MPTPLDHSNLKPQKTSLKGRYILLAIIVHVFLIVALSINVNWRSESPPPVLVELWTEPELTEPPTETPTEKQPEPVQEPVIQSKPPVQVQDPVNDADIALQEAKRKEEEERKAAAEKARQEEEDKRKKDEDEKEKQRLADQEKVRIEAAEQAEKDRIAKEKAEKEAAEKEAAEQAEKDRIAKEEAKKEEAKEEAAERERIRQEQLIRMTDMAGGSPDGNSNRGANSGVGGAGNSNHAAYAARLAETVKRHIAYTEDRTQNIRTEVYVEIDTKGYIKLDSIKITKASGNKTWDDAVVGALQKTKKLPADTNGRYPDLKLKFTFRPSEL